MCSYISSENAKIARTTELRKLLNQDQLQVLYDSDENIRWLSSEITQDKTPEFRYFLIHRLNVEEVNPDSFARKVNYEFLKKQDNEWYILFYKFLKSHVSPAFV